jgi:hypothetical protein
LYRVRRTIRSGIGHSEPWVEEGRWSQGTREESLSEKISRCMDRLIKEAIEIELHPNSIVD